MLLVTYKCPTCRKEHKRALVTRTREYVCTNCEAMTKASAAVQALAVQEQLVIVPPLPEGRKTRKSRSTKKAA